MRANRGPDRESERPTMAALTAGVRHFSRRSVLATLAAAIAGLVFGASWKRSPFRRSSRGGTKAGCVTGAGLAGADWVGNSQTKVLHHIEACADHLPDPAHAVYGDQAASFCVHQDHLRRIHEAIADRQIASNDDEGAIRNLRAAIAASPLSIHLYDRLIHVYGRLKQYDAIPALLAEAEQVAARQQPASERQRLHVDRFKAAVLTRVERTQRRAQASRATM